MVHTLRKGHLVKLTDSIRPDSLYTIESYSETYVRLVPTSAPKILTDVNGNKFQDVGEAPNGPGTWRIVKPVEPDPLEELRQVVLDATDIFELRKGVQKYLAAVSE